MPQTHSFGPFFVQHLDLPVQWGKKVCVRGWSQEIEPPYRTASPILLRLPRYKALAFGIWTGSKDETEALESAIQRREVTYDDFQEEAGWTDPDSYREEGRINSDG